MSILALVGAILAIIICIAIAKFAITALSSMGHASQLLIGGIWLFCLIVCVFIIAFALHIPIPYFTL